MLAMEPKTSSLFGGIHMNSTMITYVAIGLIAGLAVEHFTHIMDRFLPGGM